MLEYFVIIPRLLFSLGQVPSGNLVGMLDVTSLVDSYTPLSPSTSVHVLLALGEKNWKREKRISYSR